jgi:pimeloyl-ACP methyl ester carboxylesterase
MPELMRDGVRLACEVTGSGEPSIVFVHGWTCDRSHFAPQVARFSARHQCVSVDLRGHGESDAPEQDYTVAGFADDVAAVCDQLGVRDALLVGHSMGGAIVLDVAARRPDLVRGVALLDPAILFPAEAPAAIAQLAAAFGAPGGMKTLRDFEAAQFFRPASDPALKERILDAACKTPQHVVASAFAKLPAFDAESALRALKTPLLYVGAEPALADVARLREFAPQALVGSTAGSGHFHQLEVPDQINAMFSRFFEIVAAAPHS